MGHLGFRTSIKYIGGFNDNLTSIRSKLMSKSLLFVYFWAFSVIVIKNLYKTFCSTARTTAVFVFFDFQTSKTLDFGKNRELKCFSERFSSMLYQLVNYDFPWKNSLTLACSLSLIFVKEKLLKKTARDLELLFLAEQVEYNITFEAQKLCPPNCVVF